jgi:hypothetical protein
LNADVSTPTATLELVERDAHVAALEECLADVAAGTGRVVLVAGEAGVGKTALVRAFCAGLDPRTRAPSGRSSTSRRRPAVRWPRPSRARSPAGASRRSPPRSTTGGPPSS